MRLHLKCCPQCDRVAIKPDGDKTWTRWMTKGGVKEIAKAHQIITRVEEICSECHVKTTNTCACTIGSIT